MTVPLAAPTRMADDERRAVRDAVASVVDGERWILGPAVSEFERRFADYTGIAHVVGVASGTDALVIALTALDLPPASGVLVAANEGGYAATACRLAGLTPIVIDVDAVTMLPSAATAAAGMRDGASAIVVTHLHGEATDLAELDRWRRLQGLALVEDCAQAAGARRDGAHVGTRGDAAAFSFYPTKNLAALGDAGAVAFADAAAAARARSLREYGWGERFRVQLPAGRNSRLDELHAAVLLARLQHLDARNERRRAISARLRAAATASGLRYHGEAASTVAHHSVVLADDRASLEAFLERREVATAVHYPYLLQQMPGLDLDPTTSTPQAQRQRDQKLSLPCFPELTDSEISQLTDALEEWDATTAGR